MLKDVANVLLSLLPLGRQLGFQCFRDWWSMKVTVRPCSTQKLRNGIRQTPGNMGSRHPKGRCVEFNHLDKDNSFHVRPLPFLLPRVSPLLRNPSDLKTSAVGDLGASLFDLVLSGRELSDDCDEERL